MFIAQTDIFCPVVKSVDGAEAQCGKPAQVVITRSVAPEPFALCLECANDLCCELETDLDGHWIG
jgi:hypothetical protein